MTWERLSDPASGKNYYYNKETQITQWEFPDDLTVDTLGKHGWGRALTDDGKAYFYNGAGESVWDIPGAVMDELRSLLGSDLSEGEVKGEGSEDTGEGAKEENNSGGDGAEPLGAFNSKMDEEQAESTAVKPAVVAKVNEILGIRPDVGDEDMAVDTKEVPAEDAEKDYIQMLRESGVKSDCTFQGLVSKCIGDSRYWRVKEPLERKRIFERYAVEEENREFLESKEKYKVEFFKLMQEHNVKYYTRWVTFDKTVEEARQLKYSEDIKREFFDEYVQQLRREKETMAKENKRKDIKVLEQDLMASVQIDSQFAILVPQLEEKYKNLSKLDILDVFEKVMAEREKEHVGNVEREKKLNYRSDRVARSAFKAMLQRRISEGKFEPNSRTRWYEFVGSIKDEPEFTELCGHRGSSAIDFYWDLLDRENAKLGGKIELFKQQLINANKKLADLDQASFVRIMKDCSKAEIASMDELDIGSVYLLMKQQDAAIGNKRPASATDFGVEKDKRQKITLRRGGN